MSVDIIMSLFSGAISMFLENPLAQTLGFAAMFVGFFGYTTTDDHKTIKIFIAANLVWFLHFFFMENFGALGATFIGLLRLVLSLKYRRNIKVLLGIILLSIIFGIFTFDGNLISIIPLLATAISSYGFFFLEKVKFRLMLLFISSLRFTYHLGTGSISGLVNEIIMSTTLCISMYHFFYGEERRRYLKERIKNILKKRPHRPDFGRFIFLRDKDRFK